MKINTGKALRRVAAALFFTFLMTLQSLVFPIRVRAEENQNVVVAQDIKHQYQMGSITFLIASSYMTFFLGCMDFASGDHSAFLSVLKSSILGGNGYEGLTFISMVISYFASLVYLGSDIFITNTYTENVDLQKLMDLPNSDDKQGDSLFVLYKNIQMSLPIIKLKQKITDIVMGAFAISSLIALTESLFAISTFKDYKLGPANNNDGNSTDTSTSSATGGPSFNPKKRRDLSLTLKAAADTSRTNYKCNIDKRESFLGPLKSILKELLGNFLKEEEAVAADLPKAKPRILGLDLDASVSRIILTAYKAISVNYKSTGTDVAQFYSKWMYLPTARFVMFSSFSLLGEEASRNLYSLEAKVNSRLKSILFTCAQLGNQSCVKECSLANCSAN